MGEFVFKDGDYKGEWLKAKDLKEGHVYIIKDGRLALYLGKSVDDFFCFYIYCNIQLKPVKGGMLSFSNYELQLNSIINLCNALMKHVVYMESMLVLKGMPKIHCEFPFVEYSSIYKTWYTKSATMLGNLPVLSQVANVKASRGFIGARDLIPGELYYTGECWRSEYVYLGRTSDKRFIWYFIGNEDILVRSTAYQLLSRAETTNSNKKVKPLAEALNDSKAYVSDDCKKLISMNYRVDMTGITQEMLDSV